MANENPHRLEATIAGDAMAPVLARPDIGWYDLDVQRFLAWNCSIFFGIRCVIYPSLLIKTRMQAQRKVQCCNNVLTHPSRVAYFFAAGPLHRCVERTVRYPKTRGCAWTVPGLCALSGRLHLLADTVYACFLLSLPHSAGRHMFIRVYACAIPRVRCV